MAPTTSPLSKCLLSAFATIFISCAAQAQHARFNPTPYVEQIGSSPDYIGTGDINGDGLTDIAIATESYGSSPHDKKILLWLQAPGGQLQSKISFSYIQPGTATAFCVADLYGNGKSEVLIAVGNYTCIYEWKNGSLQLTDSFKTISNYGADGITTGDFDNDGLRDIGISHWGGNRITVIYQNGEQSAPWDMRHYAMPTNGYGQVSAGRFGPLQQDALIYVNGQGAVPMNVLIFDAQRQLQNKYDMQVPGGIVGHVPHAAAVVKKDSGPNELWMSYGGNVPNAHIGIWRGLQSLPDSTFGTFDSPEALQSANLDCDAGDEPVAASGGWHATMVYADDSFSYNTIVSTHIEADGVALGDINNDGKIDICMATGPSYATMVILYNITSPCWPAAVHAASAAEVRVFPNPATTTVAITGMDKGKMEVYDAQGRLAYRSATALQTTIDIASWPEGIYTLRLTADDGRSMIRKLVKY